MTTSAVSTNSPAKRHGRRLAAATVLATAATLGSLLFNPAPALAKPKPTHPQPALCAMSTTDGDTEYYLPGETYTAKTGDVTVTATCGGDGRWQVVSK